MIEQFMAQMKRTEARYAAHEAQREERQRNLETLGQGGDWRKIDDPARIVNRLQSLGMTDEIAQAMAAEPEPEVGADIEMAVDVDEGEKGIVMPPPPGPVTVPLPNVLERILNQNELINGQFLIRGAAVARSVGRIVIRNAQRRHMGYGTGFMVSPRLLMTNNHVLESAATAQHSVVQFNYYELFDGRPTTPVIFDLEPQVFFMTNDALDFTLVAVCERNADGVACSTRGWNQVIPTSGKTIVGERVNIIQHPGGDPQLLALRDNKITDLLDDFLHYSADTDRGSSGSPVLNDQWELAALHHAGVPQRDESRRILLVSGDPWDGSAARVGQIAWVANEGTRISRIVDHVRARQAALTRDQQALFEQVFSAPPEPVVEATDGGPALGGGAAVDAGTPARSFLGGGAPARGGEAAAAPSPAGGPRVEGGQLVWTVTIEIRIGLGGLAAAAAGGEHAGPAAAAFMAGAGGVPPQAPAAADPPELRDALDRAAAAETRLYYDAEQDAADREAYYAEINTRRRAAGMFDDLHKLVTDTHTTVLTYDAARLEHLYPWVDLRETEAGGRELRSIYSGKGFSPQEVIREDFAIEAHRQARLQEIMATESSLTTEAVQVLLDDLEASSPFNCEHVVPQSWFQGKQPMKADLHHLFTCEWGCNSFRNNIPYGRFDPLDEATRDDCGERDADKTRFEPAAGKGPVARATLYFMLRYPGLAGDEAGEFPEERLLLLIQWHEAEPVTDYERHRNQAIYAVQGNRNPFVDFPEWVGRVFGG